MDILYGQTILEEGGKENGKIKQRRFNQKSK